MLYDIIFNLYNPNSGNFFNTLRVKSGGDFPEIPKDDLIIEILSLIAKDVFPNFLIIPSNIQEFSIYSDFSIRITRIFYNHLGKSKIESAILDDPDLSTLFPKKGTNSIETTGYISLSTGTGCTLQLSVFIPNLLISAYIYMRLKNQLTLQNYYEAIRYTVNLVRKAAKGESIKVPVVYGFHNIECPSNLRIQLPFGIIRSIQKEELCLIPNNARFSTSTGHGPLGFIFETEIEFKILDRQPIFPGFGSMKEYSEQIQSFMNPLQDLQQKLALTLFLAIERKPPIGFSNAWRLIFDPIGNQIFPSIAINPTNPIPFYTLKTTDVIIITEWANKINKIKLNTIQIAINRIISAITNRNDPKDGFIDTIIAWENLFGNPNGETSFRISMAMASLLEEEPDKREQCQKHLRELYDDRSKLIHGGSEITYDLAIKKRDDALDLIIKCLTRLYKL